MDTRGEADSVKERARYPGQSVELGLWLHVHGEGNNARMQELLYLGNDATHSR